MCCVNAFSNSNECTLAYCMSCFDELEQGWNGGRKRKQRIKRKRGEEAVEEEVGTCGAHLPGDLKNLMTQDDKQYLASNRKNESGINNIVTNCWKCGSWF